MPRSEAEGSASRIRKNGAPDQINLELILEELQGWEEQLRNADIDWDTLEDVELDEIPIAHLDLGDGP